MSDNRNDDANREGQPSDRVDTERVNFADLSQNEDPKSGREKSESGFAFPTPSTKRKKERKSSLKNAKIEKASTGSETKIKTKADKHNQKPSNGKAGFNFCICFLALFFKGITIFV